MASSVRWYPQRAVRAYERALSQAVESSAVQVWSTARRTSAFKDRTGSLRHSIRIEKVPVGRGRIKYVVAAGTIKNRAYVWKGADRGVVQNPYYAIYLELGTRKMMARPFMRPAWNKHKYKFRSALRRLNRRFR